MLFNGTWTLPSKYGEDAYGLQKCWQRRSSLTPGECGPGGVQWLMDEIRYRHDRFDYRRFILHLPAGRAMAQAGNPLPSAQWHVLDDAGIETQSGSVREDLQQELTDWLKEKPDVQVLIYQGLRFVEYEGKSLPRAWLERGDMARTNPLLRVPDLTDANHRTVVRQNTLGWLNLTPPRPYRARPQIGFAFDNTGVDDTRDALVEVVEDSTLFGSGVRVFVSGEAIPHAFPTQQENPLCRQATLIGAYTTRAPWMATMDVFQRYDRDGVWEAGPGMHLGFAVRDQEFALIEDDRPCRVERKATSVRMFEWEVQAAICSAYRRGFVIIHYGGTHDQYIRDLHALPREECQPPAAGSSEPAAP
jgi:hypothetical protein